MLKFYTHLMGLPGNKLHNLGLVWHSQFQCFWAREIFKIYKLHHDNPWCWFLLKDTVAYLAPPSWATPTRPLLSQQVFPPNLSSRLAAIIRIDIFFRSSKRRVSVHILFLLPGMCSLFPPPLRLSAWHSPIFRCHLKYTLFEQVLPYSPPQITVNS